MESTLRAAAGREAPFEIAELFFSTTDRRGRIEACNDVFLRIAGFPPEELIGAPHRIVRHGDTPRCLFRLFWSELEAGRPVGAYVKNRTMGGDYYWVYALAFPLGDGFISLRFKPSSPRLAEVGEIYGRVVEAEGEHGGDREAAIEAGGALLLRELGRLAGPQYADFMVDSLRVEFEARARLLAEGADAGSASGHRSAVPEPASGGGSARVLAELHLLDRLADEAQELSASFHGLSDRIHRVALNAAVTATRLGTDAAVLRVLSDQVARLAAAVSEQSHELDAERVRLSPVFRSVGLQAAAVQLAGETRVHLAHQIATTAAAESTQVESFGLPLAAIARRLDDLTCQARSEAEQRLEELRCTLRRFDAVGAAFRRVLMTAAVTHVTGRAVASGVPDGGHFETLMDEMRNVAEQAREGLEALLDRTADAGAAAARWTFT